jgi:hypothetical protein
MYHDKAYYYVQVFVWTTCTIHGEEVSDYEPIIHFESENYKEALAAYEAVQITIDTPQASLIEVNEYHDNDRRLKWKDETGNYNEA